MKKVVIIVLAVSFIAINVYEWANSEETRKEIPFFNSSLHSTARGMAYWYDKAQGGLETLTGIPYSKLYCQNCHVPSCDACHKTEVQGKAFYSTKVARNKETCLHCHKRAAAVFQIDKSLNVQDVHSAKGMQCMNCHSAREVHGDGNEYNSAKQPGVLDITCEKCHQSVTSSASHKVHGGKLDCKSCHVRHVVSCSNCHMESFIKKGEPVAIPLAGWVFLMNYNNKVTSANMQTFVVQGNKTFLMFAPQNSHSIMKAGRKCKDCHGTEIIKQVQNGRLNLTWLEKGELKHVMGVIPVMDGVTYDSVYQNYQEGKWIPIENPAAPVVHYSSFGKPLTKEQLNKLSMPMGKK